MAFLLMQDLFITALTQPCKKNEGHPRPLCCLGDWIPRAETCPAPPSPSKMQKSLNFLPSPEGWGCSLRKGNSTCGISSRSAHAGWKKSPFSSGMSQVPLSYEWFLLPSAHCRHPHLHQPEKLLLSELPTPTSLRKILHGWFAQQIIWGCHQREQDKEMAACCPLAAAYTRDDPPWDAGGALGCSVEGRRTRPRLLQIWICSAHTAAARCRPMLGL